MPPKQPPRSPSEEVALFLQCQAWVAQLLPPSTVPPGFQGYREAITGALAQELRRQGAPLSTSPETALLHSLLGRAIEAAAEVQPDVLWLLTSDLIHRYLNRTLGRPNPRSQEGERLLEIKARALEALDAGMKPLNGFRTTSTEGGHFWSYLQTCVHNAVIDQLRLKGLDKKNFWSRKVPAQSTPSELDSRAGGVILHVSTHPEGRLNRGYRARGRAEAIELVATIARAHPEDRACQLALEFIDWLKGLPEGAPNSQTEFARQRSLPKGTVNASMKRFRDRYLGEIAPAVSAFYTTTGGGR